MRKALPALAALYAATAIVAVSVSASSSPIGAVFVPNPVQSTGDESLTDQKDSDAAVPANAYYTVRLTNLDGSGYLHGDYATVVSETGNPAYSAAGDFRYMRHADEFEQVMGYFWITEAPLPDRGRLRVTSRSARRAPSCRASRRRRAPAPPASTSCGRTHRAAATFASTGSRAAGRPSGREPFSD
jgi:hypothetical protein